jgi:hypothetical protein
VLRGTRLSHFLFIVRGIEVHAREEKALPPTGAAMGETTAYQEAVIVGLQSVMHDIRHERGTHHA